MSPLLAKGGSELPPHPRTTPHPHIVFNPHHQQTLAIQHQSVPTALIYYMLLILSHFGVDSPIWYNPTRRCFMVIFFILCFIELPIDESWTILRLESNIITIDNEIDTQLAACYQIFIDLFYILQVGTFIMFPKNVYIVS